MQRCVHSVIVAVVLLACSAGFAAAQTYNVRALLVGNAFGKPPVLEEVPNTLGDIRQIKDILAGTNKVDPKHLSVVENGSRRQIYDAWSKLLTGIKGPTVVIFFYSGHGVEIDGKNYLIPADAAYPQQGSERQIEESYVSLNGLLSAFQSAKLDANKDGVPKTDEDLVGIFILNACRSIGTQENEDVAVSTGLGPPRIPPSSDIFVMYASGTGRPAIAGRKNEGRTLYARHLADMLQEQSTRPLADIAQALRYRVSEEAKVNYKRPQIPAYYDQLKDRLNLFGAAPNALSGYDLVSSLPVLQKAKQPPPPDAVAIGPLPLDCENCPALVGLKEGKLTSGTTSLPVNGFAIGKFEVTNTEWNMCARSGDCSGGPKGISLIGGRYRGEAPVTDVSWEDAQKYLEWLRKVTGQTSYRLPTEIEWEYAATTTAVEPKKMCEYANAADLSIKPSLIKQFPCVDHYARGPAPVGSFRPNDKGLHDMLGNVWEWTGNCWDEMPFRGTTLTADCERVARGGSWRSGPDQLSTALRINLPQGHHRSSVGFRVARDLNLSPKKD